MAIATALPKTPIPASPHWLVTYAIDVDPAPGTCTALDAALSVEKTLNSMHYRPHLTCEDQATGTVVSVDLDNLDGDEPVITVTSPAETFADPRMFTHPLVGTYTSDCVIYGRVPAAAHLTPAALLSADPGFAYDLIRHVPDGAHRTSTSALNLTAGRLRSLAYNGQLFQHRDTGDYVTFAELKAQTIDTLANRFDQQKATVPADPAVNFGNYGDYLDDLSIVATGFVVRTTGDLLVGIGPDQRIAWVNTGLN